MLVSSQFSSHPLNSLSIFVQFNTYINSVQSPFVQFNSYIHSMFVKINSILGSGSSGKIDSILGSELVFQRSPALWPPPFCLRCKVRVCINLFPHEWRSGIAWKSGWSIKKCFEYAPKSAIRFGCSKINTTCSTTTCSGSIGEMRGSREIHDADEHKHGFYRKLNRNKRLRAAAAATSTKSKKEKKSKPLDQNVGEISRVIQ